MAKVRVYELAREYGLDSKDVLSKLQSLGEFVRSPSSTVEPPVIRKFQEAFPDLTKKAPAKAAPKAATKAPAKAAPKPAPTSAPPAPTDVAAAPNVGTPAAPPKPNQPPGSTAPVPTFTPAPANRPPRTGGNNPFTSRNPRPGNNPFMRRDGGGRPGAPGAPGAPTGGVPGAPRPGMPRPMRPGGPMRPGQRGPRPGGFGAPRPGGGRPGGGVGVREPGGGRPGAPGGPSRGPAGGRGGRGGRPGAGRPPGRGVGGAFGRTGQQPRRARKSKKARREEFDNMEAPQLGGVVLPRGDGRVVRLARGASLSDFADKIDANPAALVTALFHLGEMATATQSLGDDTLQLLGSELNYTIEVVSPEDEDRELLETFDLTYGETSDSENMMPRPPVVTVMGHVDHGKTKLLDSIREANVVSTEAGGITQHIGAYQVGIKVAEEPRTITFIDTPGHEAFTAMRARGAKATDIAVLVVAADDGVMPQTIEALNHAQAAEVPIVVAVNKIDRPDADPIKVRGQLSEYGLIPEEYGGETMFIDVSAVQKQGLDKLLEAVVLTADATLELKADPTADAQGVVIEAHLDRGRGPVATVLIQRGTLRQGDSIVVGEAYGRVRAMLDENGVSLEDAGPARPVQVLGLTSTPDAGDSFLVVTEDRIARQIAQTRAARERNAQLAATRGRRTLEDFLASLERGESSELRLIIKGDVSGSVEALEDALLKLDVGEEVSLRVIHRGVGAITKNDVTLANASDAIIIGFNVRAEGGAKEAADRDGVEIRYYSIIYQAIEEVEAALKGLLKPIYEEIEQGVAEIREVFRSSKFGNIAGVNVRSGLIKRGAKARLVRDGAVVNASLTIDSLRRFKDDVTELRDGFDGGISFSNFNDIKVGDLIETYEMKEKPRE